MPSPSTWQEVRQIVLARDRYRCVSCGVKPESGETDIHHLVPRSAGGLDEPGNLITLCDGCHAARHPNLQASLARRTIERWGLRLARWLDLQRELERVDESLGPGLRLLGVDRFRHPQLDVVLAALRGQSVLFVSATGSGKSLCFQLPVLLRRGVGVVISPLKALMSQQVAGLQAKQIPGSFINSDLSLDEKRLRYQLLRDGALKFLFCTPERFDPELVKPKEITFLSRLRPSFLVVDEAHCVDKWGNDFRPSYSRLAEVRRMLGDPPVLAFTATAGAESQQRILASLGVPDARVIVTGVNRPNIALARLSGVGERDRYRLIAALLGRLTSGRAMLFVPTVKVGEQLRLGLQTLGLDVPFYHSQLGSANDCDLILGRFTGRLSPEANVVICTNAFGMGLDVPNVRLVVHWQHPASMEDYLQEFGRAGRDGKPSVAVLFTGPDDVGLLRFMAQKTTSSPAISEKVRQELLEGRLAAIETMRRQATNTGACLRRQIGDYFGSATRSRSSSLARRLMRWLFERKRTESRFEFCCDRCNAVSDANLLEWAGRVLAAV
jgi:ATP-dependent DNA helicase RecQ